MGPIVHGYLQTEMLKNLHLAAHPSNPHPHVFAPVLRIKANVTLGSTSSFLSINVCLLTPRFYFPKLVTLQFRSSKLQQCLEGLLESNTNLFIYCLWVLPWLQQ